MPLNSDNGANIDNFNSQKRSESPIATEGLAWWKNVLRYRTGVSLTEEESERIENEIRKKNLPKQCANCVRYRDWMMTYSPSVRFMMDHVQELGGNLNKSNIVCGPCDGLKGGGFHPQDGILLCANWIRDKWHLEDTLTHELVHAYDYLKFKVDLSDLQHHACTEIRASMLSGECRLFNEIQKTGFANFGSKFQSCIKRRAILSVAANPYCKDTKDAENVVNSVWSSCFNDTRPFERVYR